MDALSLNALNGLRAALTALFPEPDIPTFSFRELNIRAAGLGGFVAESTDPGGDILARRLDALLAVTALGADRAGLQTASTTITNTLLAADRAQLAQLGLHRIALDQSGAPRPPAEGETQFVQDLFFKVRYEFIQKPQAEGDRIQEIEAGLAFGDHSEQLKITEN